MDNNYKPFWATTRIYNPKNYYLNDKNYYNNVMTVNTVAIPKERASLIDIDNWLNEISDEYTKPLNTLTSTQ